LLVILLLGCYAGGLRMIPEESAQKSTVQYTTEDLQSDLYDPFMQLSSRQRWIDQLSSSFLQPEPKPTTVRDARSPIRVAPVLTQWGEPWNREQICVEMNRILKANHIQSKQTRVRMIAHAIVASGWRQKVWNYNAWGVQQGSWKGPWFKMSTQERDKNGRIYDVFNAGWRSFSGWSEAIRDYQNRISPKSKRPSYRQAHRALSHPHKRADLAFWNALSDGNYFTNRQFTPKKFAMVCNIVRRELARQESLAL